MESTDENGWTMVTRPARPSGKRRRKGTHHSAGMSYRAVRGQGRRHDLQGSKDISATAIFETIKNDVDILRNCPWWASCGGELSRSGVQATSFMCAGLGSFRGSSNARVQLSAAMRLRLDVVVPSATSVLADPAMERVDEEVARFAGFSVVPDAAAALSSLRWDGLGVLLLFMPHCERQLYNEVFATLWGKRLEKVVLIGNFLTGFYGAGEGSPEKWGYMDALIANGVAVEKPCLDASSSVLSHNAFNDLSITYFDASRATSGNFWSWKPTAGVGVS